MSRPERQPTTKLNALRERFGASERTHTELTPVMPDLRLGLLCFQFKGVQR